MRRDDDLISMRQGDGIFKVTPKSQKTPGHRLPKWHDSGCYSPPQSQGTKVPSDGSKYGIIRRAINGSIMMEKTIGHFVQDLFRLRIRGQDGFTAEIRRSHNQGPLKALGQ